MPTEPKPQLTYKQMRDLGQIIHNLMKLVKGKKRAEAESDKRFIDLLRGKRPPSTHYEVSLHRLHPVRQGRAEKN